MFSSAMCSPVECILTGRAIGRNWLPSVFSYSRDDKKPVGICLTNDDQHSVCPDQNQGKNRLNNESARFIATEAHARKRMGKPNFIRMPRSPFSLKNENSARKNASFPPHPVLLTARFSGTLGFHENIFSLFYGKPDSHIEINGGETTDFRVKSKKFSSHRFRPKIGRQRRIIFLPAPVASDRLHI